MERPFVKVLAPGGYDFGEPTVRLVKASASGLRGGDLREFVKRAGHQFADSFQRIRGELKPGDVPVHLIGLGATEFYGPNRNGDGFKCAACRKYHDTFVKYARWYHNHCNKDPEKSYGLVKLSAFNEKMKRVELLVVLNGTKEAAARNGGLLADEEMEKLGSGVDLSVSMACGKPGTLVKMRRGFVAIEDVEPGDEVLTKYGRYRRVYATLRRVKRHVARVSTRYYGRQVLEFTPDHKFWVARWQDIPAPPQRNTVRSNDPTGYSRDFRKKYRESLHAHARYVPCGDLKPGDLLLMPIDRGDGSSTLSRAEARLLGYYLAEGSVFRGSSTGVCFTCNKKDALVEEIGELATAGVRVRFYKHSASDKAYNLCVYDRGLADSCEAEVGRGVRNKVVPRRVIDAPAEMKLEFLSAWFNGDGWQDVKGLHWSTCSRSLSLELQNLLASLGVPATVYRIDHTSDLPRGVKRTGDGTEYSVNVSNRYSGLFACRSKAGLVEMAADKTTVFVTGNYLAVPVRSVEVREEECEVYDISVEEDESFTAFGLAVSNCKVPWDRCSSCGNQARNRDEYCTGVDEGGLCKAGGLKNRIATVTGDDDNPILHADNPDPLFFDMSKVARPADRIAFTTGMMKSAGAVVPGGAALAEALGVTVPCDLEATGAVAEMMKLARRLAECEERLERAPADRWRLAFADQPVADWAGHGGRMGDALQALALVKVAMPLEGFLELVGRDPAKVAVAAAAARPHLRMIYSRLVKSGELVPLLEGNPFVPAGELAPLAVRRWAQKKSADFSLEKQTADRRVLRAAVRHGALPAPRSSGGHVKAAGAAEEIAKHYATYKLAFAHAVSQRGDQDLDLTLKLCVVQNYV